MNVVLIILAGNTRYWSNFLYSSSASVCVWSSVCHAVLLSGYRDSAVKYHVDIVSIQW